MPRTKTIIAAANEYSEAIKDRLKEKAAEGFTGWDKRDIVPDEDLHKRIAEKILRAHENFYTSPQLAKKHLVDIGALSMMLYKRVK
jgi:hypothetical protein